MQPHHWPTIQAFSFGGGGGSGTASLGQGSSNDDAGSGGSGAFCSPLWRSVGGGSSARRAWLVVGGVAVAVFIAVALRGGGDDLEGKERAGESRGWRGGVLALVHGRSHVTVDPYTSLFIMPGRSTSGFHQAGIPCTKREAKHEVFGEYHEG